MTPVLSRLRVVALTAVSTALLVLVIPMLVVPATAVSPVTSSDSLSGHSALGASSGQARSAKKPKKKPKKRKKKPKAKKGRAIVESRIIGRSVRGRPVRAWRLGEPSSSRKVVLMAAMHGNEPAPARILRNLRDGRRVAGADVWVIPVVNPDGVANRNRRNAHGVDLNRNFPVEWVAKGGSYNSGSSAASEPETVALMEFLTEIEPGYVISLHQPLNGIDTSYSRTRTLAIRLSKGLGLPRKVFNCGSGCHGTMTQWFNATFSGMALTVEYGRSVSKRQARVTGPTGLLRAVGARHVGR